MAGWTVAGTKYFFMLPKPLKVTDYYIVAIPFEVSAGECCCPSVDVVFVLDHERLFHDLQRELPESTQIVPLPKSGGVSCKLLNLYIYISEDSFD